LQLQDRTDQSFFRRFLSALVIAQRLCRQTQPSRLLQQKFADREGASRCGARFLGARGWMVLRLLCNRSFRNLNPIDDHWRRIGHTARRGRAPYPTTRESG
jgi:hypothetical protein